MSSVDDTPMVFDLDALLRRPAPPTAPANPRILTQRRQATAGYAHPPTLAHPRARRAAGQPQLSSLPDGGARGEGAHRPKRRRAHGACSAAAARPPDDNPQQALLDTGAEEHIAPGTAAADGHVRRARRSEFLALLGDGDTVVRADLHRQPYSLDPDDSRHARALATADTATTRSSSSALATSCSLDGRDMVTIARGTYRHQQ